MGDTASPLHLLSTRVRPAHLALVGALVVGWTAGRAARAPDVPVDDQVDDAEELSNEPAEVVEPPRAPTRPPTRRIRGLRRVALMTGIAFGVLLLSGAGISIGPSDAGVTLLTQEGLAPKAHRVAIRKRPVERRADTGRLSGLRHLQAAGIAGRGFGQSEVVVRSVARKVQTTAQARPSANASPFEQFVSALGPDTLFAGLEASRDSLQREVLNDSRIQIYPAGRADVSSGKLDVRILALLVYLAQAHGSVTVSCLISGHSLYVHGRPGVVSAHIFGRAVDISAVGGIPILGNQQPGGITDVTVRELIALPPPLQPAQVISLLSLSGPSFALPDHANHIHVGY